MSPMTPIDVFAFRHAADPRISPDGRRIAYLLMARDIATDSRTASLMLSDGRAGWRQIAPAADAPRWSPDSRRIAYLRRDGAAHELVVQEVETGAVTVVASAPATLRDPAWSPDGTQLAWQQMVAAAAPDWVSLPQPPAGAVWGAPARLTERLVYRHDQQGDLAEGSFQVMLAPAAGGPARQLTTGPWSSGFLHGPGLAWSADGRAIILSASRDPDWDLAPTELDLHRVDVATGAVTRLTDHPGAVAMPAVAADGRLAYTAPEQAGISAPLRRLHVIAPGGQPRLLLAGLDRSIDGVAWAGDALVVSFDDHGGKVIARVGADGSLTRLVADVGGGNIDMPYSSGSFTAAADGTIAYTRSASDLPSELAVIDPQGSVTTLTALNPDLPPFACATMFWATASLDGAPLQCWLLRPPGTAGDAPLPLILEVHGGPFAAYGDRFSIKHQCFAAAGYAVLWVNPRGSIGYGAAFAQALHDRHPGPDHTDLMDAVDAAIARGGIDPDRLHITGTSGGGVLTLWAVTHTDRFASAVSLKPVVNQESWMLTADIGGYLGDLWFGGVRPWDDRQKFLDRSPLAFVAAVVTPTMLIAGERDSRTPITEAQQMFAALKLRGVPTALVSLPDARHSTNTMRPSAFAQEIAYTLAWFARHP